MATVLLADLDNGPQTCILLQLWHKFNSFSSKPAYRAYFLRFSQDSSIKHRAAELQELLALYKEKAATKKELHLQLITQSVATWIFSSNKIEFAGTATLGETEQLITGQAISNSTTAKEVTQTFELLKKTYSSSSDLTSRQLTKDSLNDWHEILFSNILKHPGTFRRLGVMTESISVPHLNLASYVHYHPHHQIVSHAITVLSILASFLTKEIDNMTSDLDKIINIFSFAAFVQFHFVDIHSYVDGNGRLCRFLSKYYLDSILPLPFPMFKNREVYLAALVSGGTKDPEDAPARLMLLLLDSAISYYKEKLAVLSRSYDKFLFATSATEFEQALDMASISDEKERKFLVANFNALKVGSTELTSPHTGKVYQIKKEEFVADLDVL